MITKLLPKEWQDLQNKVSEILHQSNFSTKIEHTLNSVRGSYEIDVYAEEEIDDRKYTIICECKKWRQDIPQSVILTLRTILNDTGVEKGYIITTSDYQKGSYESSSYTNIKLLTWEEFQKEFFNSWYLHFFYNELNKIIDSKYSVVNFQFYEDFEKIDKKEFSILKKKYLELSNVLKHFPHPFLISKKLEGLDNIYAKLPLIKYLELEYWEKDTLSIPSDILNETHFQEFLEKLKMYADPINESINNLDLEIIDLD